MTNDELMRLCLVLLQSDTEEEVIGHLSKAGLWDDTRLWRYYGDREDNFSTIGNQQSAPEAALVEKIVNAVDAILMSECWLRGISPEDQKAPKSISEAVAIYFSGDADRADSLGHISRWSNQKRREISRRLTLAATGDRRSPCFTISDAGEGQTPQTMPRTLLSLDQKNKLRVHFVQGKFNMGGTGALQFCGRRNLQLIITRRHPQVATYTINDPSRDLWGFTVVRREDPSEGRKTSTYTYLAPEGAQTKPRQGNIASFCAASLPIFPEGRSAYGRHGQWGTCIKLYEYAATGFRSHMFRRDGLLSRLDILLPEIALPIRLHECRDFGGHAGSFETTLAGLSVRLEDDKAANLEEGFPTSTPLSVAGERMTAKIYAFERGKAESYRKSEGIIFTVNGQTHGHIPYSFFSRRQVLMDRLADSILVAVDCSQLSGRAREDLFMNSRDRLRSGDLREEIEEELEELIRSHPGLRSLREKRRREDIESRLQDSRPLKEVLESILRQSPTLAALFSGGGVLANPFKTKEVVATEKEFKGKRHPTYFKFRRLPYGEQLRRDCAINMRCRIALETDAVNDYFDRRESKGVFDLSLKRGGIGIVDTYILTLQDGTANLTLKLPDDCKEGELLEYKAVVSDDTLVIPFVNEFCVTVTPPQKPRPPGGNEKPDKPGKGDDAGKEKEVPSALSLPDIVEVYEDQWDRYKFDRFSALKIVEDEPEATDTTPNAITPVYTYYVNMDNAYLKSEMKSSKLAPELLRARWKYGLAILGMALIRGDVGSGESQNDGEIFEHTNEHEESSLSERIAQVSSAVAPVLLPLIDSLGALSEDEL